MFTSETKHNYEPIFANSTKLKEAKMLHETLNCYTIVTLFVTEKCYSVTRLKLYNRHFLT